MFQKYIDFQIERVKTCPQSGMLGENVLRKFEDVLKHLAALITKSTETKFIAQLTPDNPFAGLPELLTAEERKKTHDTLIHQIEDGKLIIPELLIETLTRQLSGVTDGFLEMLSRMDENRNAICEALTGGKIYHTIDELILEDGDTHNNGRSVMILQTDAGKLVYKPHDMRGDEQVYMLAKRFFDEFVGIPKSIAFGKDFGVCEFIVKSCAEGHEEAERFYYSLGGLTLFAKLFGSTDLHHTNILSCGTKPYIIDLETVFYPVHADRAYSDKQYMEHSVFHSLIMPARYKEYEFSVLNDTRKEGNSPVVDGRKVTVRNYLESYKKGYHDAYTQALAHREKIAEIVRDFPPHMPVRYIERATRVYASILRKMYHHSSFESEEGMNEMIKTLSELFHKNKKDTDEKVVASEIKQLRRGDVPYFYTYTDSLSVYGDGEELITNRFGKSAVNHILDTLSAMDDKDELFDLTCIDRAIRQYPETLSENEIGNYTMPERKGSPLPVDVALSEARRLLDEMYDLKIPTPDGRFLWGYIHDSSFGLSFSDHSLYNGFTGMALFVSALAYVSNEENVKRMADYFVNEAINEINLLLKLLKDPERHPDSIAPLGEANGLDGVLKGLAIIKRYRPEDEKRLDDLCNEILGILETTDFEKCTRADIITGVAGVISTLCRFDEYRNRTKIIRSAADRLLSMKTFEYHGAILWKTLPDHPRLINGGGHGQTGIAQALLAAAEVLDDDKYIPAAKEALEYEMKSYVQYSEKFGTWPDMRDFPPKSYMHGYCYGAPGIGIMIHHMGNKGGEAAETLRRFARESVDKLPLNISDRLCCANSAIVEYYLTTGDYDSAGDVLSAMYECKQKEGNYRFNSYSQNNGVTASFFYGLCGVGYEMLRYAFPEKIISIL
ncbi:MAG: DUF4135 domain-containing protein [Synergistaceae bacterium]|nr:DUF4135 domain-containing protein [Synergistaceae bacterium]